MYNSVSSYLSIYLSIYQVFSVWNLVTDPMCHCTFQSVNFMIFATHSLFFAYHPLSMQHSRHNNLFKQKTAFHPFPKDKHF